MQRASLELLDAFKWAGVVALRHKRLMTENQCTSAVVSLDVAMSYSRVCVRTLDGSVGPCVL